MLITRKDLIKFNHIFIKLQQTKNGNNDFKKPTVNCILNCEIHRISLLGFQNNKKIFSLSIRFNIVFEFVTYTIKSEMETNSIQI